jgi:hypothetical protein
MVSKKTQPKNKRTAAVADAPFSAAFRSGAIVLTTLREPREKFWGALLALDPAGVSLQGVELSSFEDATSAVIAGEPLNTAVLFFPMHRVERMAMDLPEGNLPSLSQRFTSRTGLEPQQALARSAKAANAGGAGA